MPDTDNSLPPSGPTLTQAFDALVTTLNARGVRYAIIGGLATLQHTRVRTTDDIDVLLMIPQVSMPGLFESLGARGFTLEVGKSVRELRDHGMTAIRFGDVIVDLLRPVIPAYARVLDRTVETQILGQTVRVSSAEGLIVMKLIAMRPQDEGDIQDIPSAYAGTLDLAFVRAELETFPEPDDPRREKFEGWVKRLGLAPER